MVGHVRAFLEMAWATVPRLMDALESEAIVSRPGAEVQIPESIYNRIDPTDFSTQVLTPAASELLALRLKNIEWNDLGDPYRVLVTLLETSGRLPDWARFWPALHEMPLAASAA
jgi:hypothetical protein